MTCDQCNKPVRFDPETMSMVHDDDGTPLVWDRRERLVHA